ncbi:PH domain-containing protein [Clostridium hydrogenum]|uniref:PH domain-containing protein n=1 Tax=Clostridium hydrogenum TaxID=2855764 RepID=UPI001F37E414|nr:PH domain-containing protein [Clostridium hydrogenum]
MKCIKPHKSLLLILYVIAVSIGVNAFTFIISEFINLYTIIIFLKVFLIAFNIYQIYFLIKCITLKYYYDNSNFYIISWWGLKKVIVPFSEIEMYQKSDGEIKGVKLYGYGRNNFAMGVYFIENTGTVNMFCTSTKDVLYLKAENSVYAVSPEDLSEIENTLKASSISMENWIYKRNKKVSLNKDKYFMIPLIIVAIIILAMIIIPAIAYWYNILPAKMPLSFDAKFNPLAYGTNKEFVFKQMLYGAYNMIILFCMYYAAYFYAKYSRKAAYKYIYISLVIAAIFLIMQIRILQLFHR